MNKIIFKNVTKIFSIRGGQSNISVLNGLNEEFISNRINFILGASGSGKTTLMKLIKGEYLPTAGEICYNLEKIENVRDDITIFNQNPTKNVILNKTIYENFRFVSKCGNKIFDEEKVDNLLSKLNIINITSKIVGKYSYGQIQRISVALVLYHSPKILLVDEPTSHLDIENSINVINQFKEYIKNSNSIVIINTHKQQLIQTEKHFLLYEGRFIPTTLKGLYNLHKKSSTYVDKISNKKTKLSGIIEFEIELRNNFAIIPDYIFLLAFTENTIPLYYEISKSKLVISPNIEVQKKQLIVDKKNYRFIIQETIKDGYYNSFLNLETSEIEIVLEGQ